MTEAGDPLAHACELVGRFFYHFSRVELQVDAAVAKLFKLEDLYAPIVTANMGFINKIYAVQSALSQGKFSVDAEATIKGIVTINDERRTVIAHSAFYPVAGGVEFARVTAKKELKTKPVRWTNDEFEAVFERLEGLESELQQIVTELQPDKVKWPSVPYISAADLNPNLWRRHRAAQIAQMPASFQPLGPLPLQAESKKAASPKEEDDEKPK